MKRQLVGANIKPGPDAAGPWQQRVLDSNDAGKAAAIDGAVTSRSAADSVSDDAEVMHGAYFLPRFVRTPNGTDWS